MTLPSRRPFGLPSCAWQRPPGSTYPKRLGATDPASAACGGHVGDGLRSDHRTATLRRHRMATEHTDSPGDLPSESLEAPTGPPPSAAPTVLRPCLPRPARILRSRLRTTNRPSIGSPREEPGPPRDHGGWRRDDLLRRAVARARTPSEPQRAHRQGIPPGQGPRQVAAPPSRAAI